MIIARFSPLIKDDAVAIDDEARFSTVEIEKEISEIPLCELDELFCANPDYIKGESNKNKIYRLNK